MVVVGARVGVGVNARTGEGVGINVGCAVGTSVGFDKPLTDSSRISTVTFSRTQSVSEVGIRSSGTST